MGYANLRFEQSADRATITLDRPEKLNALSGDLFAELAEVLGNLQKTPPDVLTIRGAGDHFSTGADIAAVPSWFEMTPREIREQYDVMHEVMDAVERLAAPVVAVLDGYVLGAALELAIAADIRIAHADAELGLPEAQSGFVIDMGGAQKLPGIVGEATTKYMLMTGERLDADRAHELGLVQEVYETEDALADRLVALETSLADVPRYVHAMNKRQVHDVRPATVEQGMEQAVDHAIAAYNEPETQRRVEEFLES